MALYFVRHGQTDWNKEKRLMGVADIEMNEAGRAEAGQTRDTLRPLGFAAVISSPLKRAIQTAEIIAEAHPDTPVVVAEELRERDFGAYEGRVNDGNYFGLWDYDNNDPQGGETPQELCARIFPFIDKVSNDYKGDVLLVAHGGVGLAVEAYFRGIPEDGNLLCYVTGHGEVKKYEARQL